MNLKFRRKEAPPEFPDVVTWAAWLYYIDQMTQIDVAKVLGVSRASVVNYLQEARERGLVSIQFDQKSISETVISKSLQAKYKLSGCVVIPKAVEESNLSERLGVAAARVLLGMLKSNDVISVAWGKTVLAAAQSIPRSQLDNLTVVQVVGSFHSTVEFSPEFCTSVLANRLNARCMNFLAPAILSSKHLKEELLKEEVLVNQFKTIKSSRIIVFGIGELDLQSTVVRTGFLKATERERYLAQGAIGTILGRMLNEQGQQIYTEMDDRMIGVSLDEIKSIPCRLAVAGGSQKVEVVRATLRGQYPTHLVTDYETANALLS
jgi:DNA-binding transcriptional regulator LsrR (DeoR family)